MFALQFTVATIIMVLTSAAQADAVSSASVEATQNAPTRVIPARGAAVLHRNDTDANASPDFQGMPPGTSEGIDIGAPAPAR